MKSLFPKMMFKGIAFLSISLFLTFLVIQFNSTQDPIHPKFDQEIVNKRDQPDLAAEWEFERTKDLSLGYPPTSRSVKAFKEVKKLFAKRKDAIPGIKWVERGPNNLGGRTRALMVDPNDPTAKKLWAGAIGGGLWYIDDATDLTAKWNQVGDIMSNIAISSITSDPTNTNEFYLSTGLGYTGRIRGAGIWKSTDAGVSWNQLASTDNEDFHFSQKIIFDAEGTLFAATRAGLYRSTNKGESWTQVIDGFISDIEIEGGSYYASTGIGNTEGDVFISNDNGVTWDEITPFEGGSRIELGVAPSDPDVLYAFADGGAGEQDIAWMAKTENAGQSWEAITIPLYLDQSSCAPSPSHFTRGQAFFDLSIWIHPENPNLVVVGGIDLHRSFNGGVSWEPISYWTGSGCGEYVHADQHIIIPRPGVPSGAFFGTDGGIWYSEDLDKVEKPEMTGLNDDYVTALFYSTATENIANSNVFLAGAQDNGTHRFTEPGINATREVTGGDGGLCFIDQDDPSIQITSFVRNNYRISLNGGLSFQNFSNGGDGLFINPTDYDDANNILYASSSQGSINKYEGIGGPVEDILLRNISPSGFEGTASFIKVSPHTDGLLFLGTTSGDLFSSTADSRASATNIGSPEFPSGTISSVDVGTTDDELIVTFSNYGVASVWYTNDGGTNWFNIEDNLPDIPVNFALFNPENTSQVLLATELGVWSSNDIKSGFPGWEPSNEGIANVKCLWLEYRPADKTVVLATFGRGLFTSDVFRTDSKSEFSADNRFSYVGQEVIFNDQSVNNNNSWSWDFGDGTTSTDQNPVHAYANPGTYTVQLSVNSGDNINEKQNYITILPVKNDDYGLADGGDFETNAGDFASAPLLGDINLWEYGTPGNVLTETASGVNVWKTLLNDNIDSASFSYSSALYTPAFDLSGASEYVLRFQKSIDGGFCQGPFGVQVQYTTDAGKNWYTLGSAEPTAGAFNWYTSGENFIDCALIDDLFATRTGWAVDSELSASEFDISFLAGETAAFRFVAAVTDRFSAGYDIDGFLLDDIEIVKNPSPRANFAIIDQNTRQFYTGDNISFEYLSFTPTTIEWDFGDGNTSNEVNPTHAYAQTGSYNVTLTVSDGTNTDEATQQVSVQPFVSGEYLVADGGNFDVNQADFAVITIAGTGFELGRSDVAGKSGTASGDFAWVTGIDDAEYVNQSLSYLYTPKFDFRILGEYRLDFKANYQFEDNWDGFIVEYSTDGISWLKLNDVQEEGWYNQISDPQAVFGAQVPIFSGNTGGEFDSFGTDVSFLGGNETVVFRFRFQSDAGVTDVGMALDDFSLTAPAAGAVTANFEVSGGGCLGEESVFTSTSTGSIYSALWDFGANADPATATGLGPHTVNYTAAGASDVTLTLTDEGGNEIIETKTGFVETGDVHTPTFSQEFIGNGTIRLTASEGDAYQWYLESEIIEGATSQVYETTEFAFYRVAVTVSGCEQFSELTVVTDSDPEIDSFLSLYPNPTVNSINVSMVNGYTGPVQISVISVSGAVMSQSLSTKDGTEFQYQYDVGDLSNGIYLVKIVTDREFVQRISVSK